ncbi:potassium voltage-gated channel protein Shaw-like [Watersipora subatra]|uniref:potassium voltage-gated channel protein Shaw-like n=1 Tax=Watersipora subatra TaxID=2589382 RepID=UPI00355C293D
MAEILDQQPKIAWQSAETPNKIIINVSGHRFVTTYRTLNRRPNTKLGSLRLANQSEHFFDKDVAVFTEVLQFQRTGELHTPKDRCREAFLKEVKFWRLGEEHLASCCRMHETFKDQSLEKQFTWFEKTIKPHGEITKRHRVWYFLTDPTGPYTKHRMAAQLWMLCYTLLTCSEIINTAIFTIPSKIAELNVTENATFDNVMSSSLQNPCPTAKTYIKANDSSGQSIFQLVLSTVFMVEILIKFVSCPMKSIFWRSFNAVDFAICTYNFLLKAISFVLNQTELYPQENQLCKAFNIGLVIIYFAVQLKTIRLLISTMHFGYVQVSNTVQ